MPVKIIFYKITHARIYVCKQPGKYKQGAHPMGGMKQKSSSSPFYGEGIFFSIQYIGTVS